MTGLLKLRDYPGDMVRYSATVPDAASASAEYLALEAFL